MKQIENVFSSLTQIVVKKHNNSRMANYFDAGSGENQNKLRMSNYFDAGSAGDQNKSRKHRMNFSGS